MSKLYLQSDVVSVFEPFVKVLKRIYKRQHCSNCHARKDKFVICRRCGEMMYCNRECQKEDWKNGHGIECMLWQFKDFKRTIMGHQSTIDLKRLLVRLYSLLKFNPGLADSPRTCIPGPDRSFNDLLQHPNYFKFCNEVMAQLQSACRALAHFLNEIEPGSGNEAELLRYPPLIVTQARLFDGEEDIPSIGWAIYVEPKFIPHSCKPSAVIHRIGSIRQLRAITTIHPQDHPTINYLTGISYLDKDVRQSLLKDRYQIECGCQICSCDTESLVDYPKLNELVGRNQDYLDEEGTRRLNWVTILKHHTDILTFLRIICNEYDTPITDQFMKSLTLGITQRIPIQILEPFAMDTFHRIMITYGEQHVFVSRYRKRLLWFFGEKFMMWPLTVGKSLSSTLQ